MIITFSYAANHSKTKLYDLNKNKYISALEYADAQKIRTIFYENKEKLEFRFQNHKLTISPHSSFIQINDIIYHMSLPVIFDGNDFFIPAEPFFNITNKIGMPRGLIDSSDTSKTSTTESTKTPDLISSFSAIIIRPFPSGSVFSGIFRKKTLYYIRKIRSNKLLQ